ncbi:hypothetical protein SSBR45G_31420 [Bradyrhizobium sp. SSBR45G]|uniref:DUF2975 domain-containing protein n=1 Tax=unclassified Bradyrhizobium TaxID=2631580 RepID=UPI00234291E4|nr:MULTISPECIES: DUF2975 domain-containing protein [unclassified Bradyrhizobium]GLH78233.1 hypothetical protein SSBR45G_31420 [Bradyrhizobium sp. SSBR45G]GLH86000.1 hypothetical protein SSBR45R_34600 [Bradyrhizobium sp. SSBR45R]
MSAMSAEAAFDDVPAAQTALRSRIKWLCRSIQLAAAVWSVWVPGSFLWRWLPIDPAGLIGPLGYALKTDMSGLSATQVEWFLALTLVVWIPDLAVGFCIWRLFGTYLQGRIFAADAAIWMRRVGVSGLAAVAADVMVRKIGLFVLTSHVQLPLSTLLTFQTIVPGDLLRILFSLFVTALALIFKAAAELADDHARIV